MTSASRVVDTPERFAFGENWRRFLRVLDEPRIRRAEESLKEMLRVETLEGRRFLDAGSGSGLFSLAARRLGAVVYSFDFDPQSVACAEELKRRYFPGDSHWHISSGSVLDPAFLGSLGQFDVVYSWGVLHHTGAMWQALANMTPLVRTDGQLFVAIYNDQGFKSRYWHRVKAAYVAHPFLRWPLVIAHIPYPFLASLILRGVSGRLDLARGMSHWYDLIDWIGGYPFEVATPAALVDFYYPHGFRLQTLRTTSRFGCNEFVWVKAL